MRPKAGDWQMTINGHETTLNITHGNSGETFALLGGVACETFWDEPSQVLTLFTIFQEASNMATELRVFKGWLFSKPPSPVDGEDVTWVLTGYVEANSARSSSVIGAFTPATARQSTFGWFAQAKEIL